MGKYVWRASQSAKYSYGVDYMYRGIYTVTSTMSTNQRKLDVVSNNLANTNTASFKKDELITKAFPEKLLSKMNGVSYSNNTRDSNIGVKRDGQGFIVNCQSSFFTVDGSQGKSYSRDMKLAADDQGYLKTYSRSIAGRVDTSRGYYVLDSNGKRIQAGANFQIDGQGNVSSGGQSVANLLFTPQRGVIGTVNGGKSVDYIKSNFRQGGLQQTNRNLDVAIKGSGFFQVQTADGQTRYTREGTFKISDDGMLVTDEGMRVMANGGPVPVDGELNIRENGDIYIDGSFFDTLSVADVRNLDTLRKIGYGTYEVEPGQDPNMGQFEGELLQGYIEGSNVNPVKEMIEMIDIMRNYESGQKVIKAYDDIMAKAANEIGKL
ncbi:flagellar basal-body rod protein FlgG [Peptoclostridium litorale DSM 5388]|uniref:Flagellar basal body rod protein n=2 Tax=Peptoclostridium litorale TaxID=1557 RepID=A0A069RCJ1_PEPLI|nr:flagellar basal body rod protein [Peptoclostridium litorale DSM 5388]SIN91662.1 flagellar basal-body rod protein FlgG [Peptoclostridium litorale DSM 5388]